MPKPSDLASDFDASAASPDELLRRVRVLEAELAQSRASEEQLRTEQERLHRGLDGSDVGVWDWNVPDDEVTFIRHWAEVLGYPADEIRPHREMWEDCVHPDDKSSIRRAVDDHLQGRTPYFETEHRCLGPTGRWSWMLYRGKVISRDAKGRPLRVVGMHMDVTFRKQAEQALWEGEARFRDAFENAALGLAMGDAQLDGLILETNAAFERMLGRSVSQLIGRRFSELLHEEDVPSFQRLWSDLVEGRRASFRTEHRYPRHNGEILGARLTMSVVRDSRQQPMYAIAIVEDITQRQMAERRLRAEKRLLRKLLELQDRERRLLAYDIHDGLVQDIVAAQMLLESFAHKLAGEASARGAEMLSGLLRKSIDEGRRLISDLRPMIIDERGIVEAIRHLVAEQGSHLQIDFAADVRFERLPQLLEGSIYRVVQEALTNVKRHAGTNQVVIQLCQSDETLELVIEDNGRGFNLDDVPEDRFGIRGICERARLFGGKADIRAQPEHGTRIHIELPLELPVE